jgi:hypothetical protein
VNGSVENIGARRLQTVMERAGRVSFTAADRNGGSYRRVVGRHRPAANADLSRFICKGRGGNLEDASSLIRPRGKPLPITTL